MIMNLEKVKHQYRQKMALKKIIAYSFLILGSLTMIAPFMWMLTTSLKDAGSVFSFSDLWWQDWIPSQFLLQNYAKAFQVVPFLTFYINSIMVAVLVTLGTVITSSCAAYSFARLHFPGRDKIFFGYLATMMIPGAVTMIPVFILLRYLGWIDTYQALIIPGIFNVSNTFMLRQFFLTLPRDLEDAAKIDGCNYFGIFWKIILPLSKPELATVTTFTFMGSWMNLMWPLIVINTHEKYTLPVGLAYFQSVHNTNWTLLMAASVMMILPILLIFIFNQRFFVEGIKLTGLKG